MVRIQGATTCCIDTRRLFPDRRPDTLLIKFLAPDCVRRACTPIQQPELFGVIKRPPHMFGWELDVQAVLLPQPVSNPLSWSARNVAGELV